MTQRSVAQKRLELSDIYSNSNLTRLQVLYWVAQQLRPTSPFLNTILTFTIDGAVDCEHFETAFQTLVSESDALRTVIDEVEGVPQGRILPTAEIELEHLDFAGQADPEAAARSWIREQSVVPLDLSERLFHAALIKTSTYRFIWYFNQHHMIADASSFFLLFERLAELYERSRQGTIAEAAPLTPFQQYVKYERAYQGSAHYWNAKAYWQTKLEPGPEPLRFFGQAPVKKTTRVDRVTLDLGVARSKKLRDVTQQQDIFAISEELTLYSLLATLFFVLLHHMSGNRRIGFVTPVHNRFNTAFRNAIGLVMEICPLQVEISKDDSFISLLKKVQSEIRETMAHYQYASGIPLDKNFDVMFNLHRMPSLRLGGLPVHIERLHPGHGSESLVLHVNDYESPEIFKLHFDFHRDVFNEIQRKQIVDSFIELVDVFLKGGNQSLSSCRASSFVELEPPSSSPSTSGHLTGENRAGKVAPRDLLEYKFVQIWEEILESHDVGIHDNFFDLGGNSWLAVMMITRVEKATGHYLGLNALLQATTIAQLAAIIRAGIADELDSTLITIQEGNGKPPLFFVPGAGGNGLAISRIARYLDEDQPVFMFQIPLGEDGRAPLTQVEEMAAHYLAALQSVEQRGPYFLAGYSAGGIVAFEVAQQLKSKGEEVALLAIIDVPAQSEHYRYVRHFSHLLASIFRLEANRELDIFLGLRDLIFRAHFFLQDRIQKLQPGPGRRRERFVDFSRNGDSGRTLAQRAGIVDVGTRDGLPDRALNNSSSEEGDRRWHAEDRWMREYYEVNNRAVKSYFPRRFPGHIVLFRSSDGYRRAEMRSADPQLGWAKVALAGVETYVIPGNHMQIVREPNVRLLGKYLQSCLDGAQKRTVDTASKRGAKLRNKENKSVKRND